MIMDEAYHFSLLFGLENYLSTTLELRKILHTQLDVTYHLLNHFFVAKAHSIGIPYQHILKKKWRR